MSKSEGYKSLFQFQVGEMCNNTWVRIIILGILHLDGSVATMPTCTCKRVCVTIFMLIVDKLSEG